MNIILLQNLENLGDKHDIVSVKPGYANNFLIPKGFGIIANKTNQAKLDKILEDILVKDNARIDEFKAMATKIEGKTIKIGVKSGTSGKIFGKVTSVQVIAALKDQYEIEIERKKVTIPEEPKEIGTYPVVIKFHADVSATMQMDLIKD